MATRLTLRWFKHEKLKVSILFLLERTFFHSDGKIARCYVTTRIGKCVIYQGHADWKRCSR